MVIKPPAGVALPSPRQFHDRKCFLLGIDRDKWEELWREKVAVIEVERAEAAYVPANGHGAKG